MYNISQKKVYQMPANHDLVVEAEKLLNLSDSKSFTDKIEICNKLNDIRQKIDNYKDIFFRKVIAEIKEPLQRKVTIILDAELEKTIDRIFEKRKALLSAQSQNEFIIIIEEL